MPLRHQGHEPMHPVGTCRSCTLRRRTIQGGNGGGKRRVAPHHFWSWNEERILRKSVGVLTIPEIQAWLLEDAGTMRTEHAINVRATRMGLSRARPGLTIAEVAYQMGVSGWVARHWVKGGLLGEPNRWKCRARVGDADLERFIREHPDLYDRRVIRSSALRSIADAVWARDPWIGVNEIAAILGYSPDHIKRLIARGTLPGRKVHGWMGRAGGLRWVARRSEITRALADQPRRIAPHGHQEAQRTAS
jgi:hypothetical protein